MCDHNRTPPPQALGLPKYTSSPEWSRSDLTFQANVFSTQGSTIKEAAVFGTVFIDCGGSQTEFMGHQGRPQSGRRSVTEQCIGPARSQYTVLFVYDDGHRAGPDLWCNDNDL